MRRVVGIVLLVAWFPLFFLFAVFGVMMSGGAVLSPSALVQSIAVRDGSALTLLATWFVLLFPLLPMWWVAYPRGWKNRHG